MQMYVSLSSSITKLNCLRIYIMANNMLLSLCLFSTAIAIITHGNAQSSCNSPCNTLNDCSAQLICINGKCKDDPQVGTQTCHGGGVGGGTTPSPSAGGQCHPSGTLKCKGKSFPKFTCSPPVSSSTPAKLTLNDFSDGGDGGGPSECDNRYHDNSERVVALSTGW